MKIAMLRVYAIVLLASLMPGPQTIAWAATSAPEQHFSDAELDELLAPIALYPDPLLAQVVPAATFIDQLEDAQRVLGGKSDDNLIANQSWDVSVRSVAHYPQVLQMMVQKADWTTALGQAYVYQSTDVGKSIQRLRAEARTAGTLVTTSQQKIVVDGQVIRIEPAQPQVIYVPQYNPEVVYVEHDSGVSTGTAVAAAAISFGAGLAIGAWLNNDWDYYGRGVYYHGWVGGGWIGVNRTFVNVNRNVYINNNFRNVNINRTVVNRNINGYRTTLNRNAVVRQQNINRTNINVNRNNINRNTVNNINRTNIDRNNINRNNVNRTDALRNRSDNSGRLDSYRGRDKQNAATRQDSNSAFGGSGNRAEIKQQRERGDGSLNRMKTDSDSGRFGSGAGRNTGGGRLRKRG